MDEKIIRSRTYVLGMRQLLKKSALFSDETEEFQSPMESKPGEKVTVRFRTARNNVDSVYVVLPYRKIRMQVTEQRNGFDYYSAEITAGDYEIYYYFQIRNGKTTCYYNKLGVQKDEPKKEYAFRIIPGFSTPDWAKGAVMYQIYPDRFYNGDPYNDVVSEEYSYINQHVKKVDDWYKNPENMDVRNFYGGDLQGVIDKMDYLKDLGIEVLYLNPIFVSASNHKYDTQDYEHVDPHLGRILHDADGLLGWGDLDNTHAKKYIARVTNKENLRASDRLFARLVEEAHKRGMKVIIDGVFNHCGSFNRWMDRERIYEGKEGFKPGAFVAEDSPYHSYFEFHEGSQWPYNGNYNGWWGHNTLPKLNYENSKELQEDILRIGRKWVSPPYNADGWRLDVAADLGHTEEFNHYFWKEFRKAVKDANPNAIILAEHYGDAAAWLKGDEWDTVMNYDAFMEPLSWFFTGMEKHSDSYREDLLGNADSYIDAMRYHMASFTAPSLLTAMNELDNHDHSRFLTRTNHRVGRVQSLGSEAASEDIRPSVLREAVVVQMTWPGAPTVYYGDEAGVCGFTDPDNRRTYPWGREDKELIRFYKEIIHIHNEHQVLRTGSTMILTRDYNAFSYGRFNAEEQIAVLINNRTQEYAFEVPVWQLGIDRTEEDSYVEQLFITAQDTYSAERSRIPLKAGVVQMQVPPESAVVLLHR
ncbi:MAG: glycoside hydrolase family 13 protein [Eubacteriales bacterium]|nr:glycoside hydrolase family 13 protein [Eubacteriales bacterium]